jgi:peroxiredoxin
VGAVISIGERLPDFALPTIDGRMRRLSEAEGEVLLLTLWSADCPYSARADAALSALEEEWGGRVQVLRIACNPNEADDAIRDAAAARGVPFVLLDRDQAMTRALGGLTTPHFFVFDRGRVLRYRGGLDDVSLRQKAPSRRYLAEAVAAMLAGGAPDPGETPSFGCAVVWRIEGPARAGGSIAPGAR